LLEALQAEVVVMIEESVIRFMLGGLIVSAFALIGDLLRPKTFAGIFGGAPSVALATLGLTFVMHGGSYAGLEGRSMVIGAVGLGVYALLIGWLLLRRTPRVLLAAGSSLLAWFACAFGLWGAFLR
jgi:hypothetical protein